MASNEPFEIFSIHQKYETSTAPNLDEENVNENIEYTGSKYRDPTSVVPDEDKNFYQEFYKLCFYEAMFEKQVYQKYTVHEISHLLKECEVRFPEMQLDVLENHNLWIVKPGAKSRGRGITVMSKLNDILRAYVSNGEPNLQKDSRWIIQKYIWVGRGIFLFKMKLKN